MFDQLAGSVIRQSLGEPCGQRRLNFNVDEPPVIIGRQDIENRSFVIVKAFADDWVQDLHVGDRRVSTQDRIKKVKRNRWMIRASQKSLARKVDRRINSNRHFGQATVEEELVMNSS
nr:hypothetical protein [Rhodopirellula sp. SM50]